MSVDLTATRIVVIGKDKASASAMRNILSNSGANKISDYPSIGEGAKFVKDNPADLIVADLDTTPLNGVAFAQALRTKFAHNKNTPLLIAAPNDDMAGIKAAVAAGASNVVLKPYDSDQFMSRVKQTLLKKAQGK